MNINERRKQIDSIDDQIIQLLVRRGEVAREISALKLAAGLPITDRTRENQVIGRLRAKTDGYVAEAAIDRIYEAILAESRRVQSGIRAELLGIGAIQ